MSASPRRLALLDLKPVKEAAWQLVRRRGPRDVIPSPTATQRRERRTGG
jgi:hypothetical protein